MKTVYLARDAVDAQLLQAALHAQGIRAIVQEPPVYTGGAAADVHPGPTVYVNDDEEDLATEIVAEFLRGAPAPGEPWRCEACNELIDAQFAACWRCAALDEHNADALPVTHCTGCGYYLRGLPDAGTCPECGVGYQRTSAPEA